MQPCSLHSQPAHAMLGVHPFTPAALAYSQRRLLSLCVQLLAAKAAKTPTLILLDNVQWMDAQSWELLIRVKHEVPS